MTLEQKLFGYFFDHCSERLRVNYWLTFVLKYVCCLSTDNKMSDTCAARITALISVVLNKTLKRRVKISFKFLVDRT